MGAPADPMVPGDSLFVSVEADGNPISAALLNAVENYRGSYGGYFWTSPTPNTVVSGGTPGNDTGRLRYTSEVAQTATFETYMMPVNPGDWIKPNVQFKGASDVARLVDVYVQWYDADGNPVTWVRWAGRSPTSLLAPAPYQTPATATITQCKLQFVVSLAAGGWFEATDIGFWSSPVQADLDNVWFDNIVYWGLSNRFRDMKITRDALDVGTLSAVLLDARYDPAVDDRLRPGRRVKVEASLADGNGVMTLFHGRLDNAEVTYVGGTAIALTANDNTGVLANTARAEGVETIDELRYVLEGTYVPFVINGRTAHIGAQTIVAINENATALDQVAITRDSNLGYAWVDREGFLQAWDADQMRAYDPATDAVLDETVYSNIDVGFSTDECINEVSIKFLRHDPNTGDTEEVAYGPYVDKDSIEEWGRRPAEFTIQGFTEDAVVIQGYAQSILDANATPRRRPRSLRLPVRVWGDVNTHGTGLDLYDPVRVVHAESGIDEVLRVSGIEQTLAPDKWFVDVEFATEGAVAAPQITPSPQPVSGKTTAQMMRPAGEVTLWGGVAAPEGWLLCDGDDHPTADYPDLFAVIGYTYGGTGDYFRVPNLTDRFPIGAGTKARGLTGGAPTKPVPPHTHSSTMPDHTHPISGQPDGTNFVITAGSGANSVPRRSDFMGHAHGGATGAVSGTNPAINTSQPSGSEFDVMPPWLSINFIIKAT